MAGTSYTVEIVLRAKNMMSAQMGKVGGAVKSIGNEFKKMGRSMEFAEAKQILLSAAIKGYQALKTGAAINQQKKALDGLARTYGTTGKAITDAMQEASGGTIDRMSAVTAANKAMILDVAKTPEAFSRLAKVATVLGRAMGQDAAKSIDDFVIAAGRQSKMIADNLGLMVSAADANKRFAESEGMAVSAMDDAAKKQAFLREMLRQGEIKMADMGEQAIGAAEKMERMEAAAKDAGNELLAMGAEVLASTRLLDDIAEAMEIGAHLAGQISIIVNAEKVRREAIMATNKAYDAHLIKTRNVVQATREYKEEVEDVTKWMPSIIGGVGKSVPVFNQYTKAVQASVDAQDAAIVSSKTYSERQVDLLLTQKKLAKEQAELAKEQAAAAALVTQKTNEATLDMGMAWTSYYADRKEQRTENVKTVREIEAEHQANMAELQKKGQSRAIHINANAEQAKLDTLKQKLALALMQQSEFTEKTKESTRVRKENQIAGLQTQIGTQTTLLDDFYNGRLVAQGENITAGLAAENERYAQEKTIAQEARAAQEEEMRLSLGRMVLQQFEAWAMIKGIPAAEMLKMKNQIATDYGLMTEEGAAAANATIDILENWAKDTSVPMDQVVAQIQGITNAVNAIPNRKVDIEINVRKTGYGGSIGGETAETAAREAAASQGDMSGGMGGAGGRGFSRGANFTVGPGYDNDSFGPMYAESGERVIIIPKGDTTTNNNFNQTINTSAGQGAVIAGYRTMQSMAG